MGNVWFQAGPKSRTRWGICGFKQVLNREQDGECMVSGRSYIENKMGNMWFQAGPKSRTRWGICGFKQVLNREQDGEYMVSGRS